MEFGDGVPQKDINQPHPSSKRSNYTKNDFLDDSRNLSQGSEVYSFIREPQFSLESYQRIDQVKQEPSKNLILNNNEIFEPLPEFQILEIYPDPNDFNSIFNIEISGNQEKRYDEDGHNNVGFEQIELCHSQSEEIFCVYRPQDESDVGKTIKNQTKNIPKNFGKAIVAFISKNQRDIQKILQGQDVTYSSLMMKLQSKKRSLNTIADLRDLWTDPQFAKVMRILSNQFLRKHSLRYIFNSRIFNFNSHVKYRMRLQEAIKNPSTFKYIKEY